MVARQVVLLADVAPSLQYLLWVGIVVFALAVLLAIMVIARRVVGSPRAHTQAQGLSIGELEALRAAGQLSEEEFRRLRRAALGLPEQAARDPGRADEEDSSSRGPGEDVDERDEGTDRSGTDGPRPKEQE